MCVYEREEGGNITAEPYTSQSSACYIARMQRNFDLKGNMIRAQSIKLYILTL